MRDDAKTIIRAIGVDTGGSNILFAVDPRPDGALVIEMNPARVRSRPGSKPPAFRLQKIAAKACRGLTDWMTGQ